MDDKCKIVENKIDDILFLINMNIEQKEKYCKDKNISYDDFCPYIIGVTKSILIGIKNDI
jgi:hypothetical protein